MSLCQIIKIHIGLQFEKIIRKIHTAKMYQIKLRTRQSDLAHYFCVDYTSSINLLPFYIGTKLYCLMMEAHRCAQLD